MKTEFGPKKMKDCQIALLTHKMNVTFAASVFLNKEVTPEAICDEVEMIGFGCDLLNMTEMNERDHSSVKKRRNYDRAESERSYRSMDSDRLYMSDVKTLRTPSPTKDAVFTNVKVEDKSASE